jgi:protein-ribulosamine 3-kinase
VAAQLADRIGCEVASTSGARVAGGCINECLRWDSSAGPLFVKVGAASALAMFEAEAAGLAELAMPQAVRVPQVRAVGGTEGFSFLALEWIELRAPSREVRQMLGAGLACLHRHTANQYGWNRDNTIGATPQINTRVSHWPSFFRDQRLAYQLELAHRNGHRGRLEKLGGELLKRVPDLLAGHTPSASLLHGDLWSGNAAADAAGRPVIFDPAVYYGDRETDLAMARLFGGFGEQFHAAYEAEWPLPAGAAGRVDLYNLYHILNHLNLFGSGYLPQVLALFDRLL